MEKIKVLHISGTMNMGGQETFIMNVMRNIDREEYQFGIVVHSQEKGYYDDEIEKLGGKIYRITPISKGIIKHCKDLARVIKSENYSIVHRHVATSVVWIEMLTAKLCGVKKRIVHSHSKSNDKSLFLHKINRPLLNLFTNYRFACSKEAGEFLFGKHKKFQIIPNGINPSDFCYSLEKRTKIRNELQVDDNELIIGHIGRFTYAKNHEFLLEIFKKITEKKKNVKLLLVGDGELRNEINNKIEELNLVKKVIMLGNRSDVATIMSGIDVFVFPSRYEGLPVTLVEAQAAGLCCVISGNMTHEVDLIPENIKRISLSEDADVWADTILKTKEKKNRVLFEKKVEQSTFNIKKTVELLQEIYSKK